MRLMLAFLAVPVLLAALLLVLVISPAEEPRRVPVPACAEVGRCVYDHESREYRPIGR